MLYENLVLLAHVILAIAVIAFVLIQRGKGAEAGASFGGGASQTVFGSSGSGNFLTRTTAVLVTLFFATSLTLAFAARQKADGIVNINLPSAVEAAPIDSDVPMILDTEESSLPTE